MTLIRIGGPPPLPSYVMDLSTSEEHSFPGEATKFPAEQGAEFTDHIRELPDELTLECIVSDTPIGDVATDPTRQPSQNPDGTTIVPLPSVEALARLREIKALRRPVRVETSLGVYTSMAFIDLNVPVDAARCPGTTDPDPKKARAGALFFTAKFRKATIVTNKRTKVRVRTPMAGAGGGPTVKAVVAKPVVIDRTVTWRHGNPPGAPFRPGGEVSSVEVGYNKPAGMTRQEAVATGAAAPDSSFIQYFDAGSAAPITGARREALVLDLRRDEAELRERLTKNVGPIEFERQTHNLPAGINLDRFQQPAPQTFPPPSVTDTDLSRFQRKLPPTFPGT